MMRLQCELVFAAGPDCDLAEDISLNLVQASSEIQCVAAWVDQIDAMV